jgi:hypothetical protein
LRRKILLKHINEGEIKVRIEMTGIRGRRRKQLLGYLNSKKILELAPNETNLVHYLSSDYSDTIPLHVSGLLVAHYQEVAMYVCDNWYVLYVLVDFGRPDWNGTRTDCRIYTMLPPDDGLISSPKHVEI